MRHLDGVNYKHNQSFINAFGANLKRLRDERGLSLRQLAEKIEIEHKQLFLIEKGKINTTISTVLALAEGLELHVTELFDFTFENPDQQNQDN